MAKLDFLRQGIKNMRTIGSVSRSSGFVSKTMLDAVDFNLARVVVELGAGDGAITEHLLKRLHPDAKLLIFEVNAAFCEELRKLPDSRITIIEDSAEHIEAYLKNLQIESIDAVISAIPFVLSPKELSINILKAVKSCMKQGASFVQLHYSLSLKKMYEEIFGQVRFEFVPINIPPAFIILCKKA